MEKEDLLPLLQADLDMLFLDETRKNQLLHLIDTAEMFIKREGVVITAPLSVEDGHLIVMYAAYLFRKRATAEPMPRMLRWTLNNRKFSEEGDENAT